ncbi:MipA/OmpV family protein [Piscinibacterium candidicorallinum]|uniref:MipA/OmpV family protein n=1 Tax=Piscinibacterium candidicorallinum TaxID=1793872 RepID=A0ABV7H9B4_9BURK
MKHPNRPGLRTLALLLGFSLAAAAHAQVDDDGNDRNKPLWEAGLVGFGLGQPAYPGAADNVSRALLVPWGVYRGKIFRVADGNVGARVVSQDSVKFDIGFAGALGASSKDVAIRSGMPDLGFQFEFGPRTRFILARPERGAELRLDLPLRAVFEAKSGINHRGYAFEPRLSYDFDSPDDQWGWQVSGSLVYADKEYAQYLYGVPAQFARAGRPAYQAQSGLVTSRVSLSGWKRLNPDWSVFGFVRYDYTGGAANTDSPLHLKNGGTAAGVGVAWTIGRSSERVN